MSEIINTQREQLEKELKGQLPGGRYANKKHYLSEAIKHLEDIHRQKNFKTGAQRREIRFERKGNKHGRNQNR